MNKYTERMLLTKLNYILFNLFYMNLFGPKASYTKTSSNI